MPSPDQYAAVYAKLISLLAAEPTFFDATSTNRTLIFPANLTNYTVNQPFPDKALRARQPGDFPAAYLVEEGEKDAGMLNSTTAYDGAYREQASKQYILWIIAPDTRISLVSALLWGAKIALLKGGVDFGLQFVWQWTFQSRIEILKTLEIGSLGDVLGGSPKRVAKITIPVSFDLDGQSLVA